MTPTQDFENYPEFANAGQKSQPNDAKYSAGFIPSDVLPAEWLNWFLNGATKGVTALNTGVKSVEQEINTVLESRSVTPDINAAGQLLAVLNKIKAEAINEAWPVGITYVQYPQQKSPQELFPKTTWVELSYDGAFFRAAGGNAAAFIEKSGVLSKQSQGTASNGLVFNGKTGNVIVSGGNHKHNVRVRNDGFPNDWQDYTTDVKSQYWHTSYNKTRQRYNLNPETEYSDTLSMTGSFTPAGSISGDSETRPDNYTMRIWKRIA